MTNFYSPTTLTLRNTKQQNTILFSFKKLNQFLFCYQNKFMNIMNNLLNQLLKSISYELNVS